MSCDFDLYCLDCEADCGFDDYNWRQKEMAAALKWRQVLQAGTGLLADPGMSWVLDAGMHSSHCGSSALVGLIRFFSSHVGHQIVVMSEYGDIYAGTCEVDGPYHQGTGRFCAFENGHAGEHHYPPSTTVWDEAAGWYKARHIHREDDGRFTIVSERALEKRGV